MIRDKFYQVARFMLRLFVIFILWLLCLTGCQTIDETKGQPELCEVHHVRMTKKYVPIEYGCPAPWAEAELKTERACYPHPGDCLWIAGESDPNTTRAIVYVCPKCEEAKKVMSGNSP